MEEVPHVNLAALKDAINRVDINGFNTALEKITSVTDLNPGEWSDLVVASRATIECDIFKKYRKKDEKIIFELLLQKLIWLSSASEPLALYGPGSVGCRYLLDGGYDLEGLYDSLKNPEGYCLRYFLNWCGPKLFLTAPDHIGGQGQERITKFKEGYILFSQMCEKVISDAHPTSMDLTVFTFLISEFGKDFSHEIFLGFLNIDVDDYSIFLEQALDVIKENRGFLNKFYEVHFLTFILNHPSEKRNAQGRTRYNPQFLEDMLRYINVFSLFLRYEVNHFQIKGRNGENLRAVVAELKKKLQQNEEAFGHLPGFKELDTAVHELAKKIDAGVVTALGAFRFRWVCGQRLSSDARRLLAQHCQMVVNPELTGLVLEFGRSFSHKTFLEFFRVPYKQYASFLSVKENVTEEDKARLNECCNSLIGGSHLIDRILERVPHFIYWISFFLEHGVNPYLKSDNGRSLRDAVMYLNQVTEGKRLSPFQLSVAEKWPSSEFREPAKKLHQKVHAGLVATLGIYRRRFNAYRDVRNLISQAIQTEMRNSPSLMARNPD
ncbi:MAG: hypothetical protein SFW07_05655 [Gammaproteobacteria bacterium]|nr:hypothetical protein [Gammaproteobacteria bacterium]